MVDGFHPPNKPAASAANVFYYFGNSSEFKYKFRWSESPVLLLTAPHLLEYLSLGLYNGHTEIINIVVNPLCEVQSTVQPKPDIEQICAGKDKLYPVVLLNKFTIHVSVMLIANQ